QGKRYCFGRQPDIARWNLERLADALAAILPNTEGLALAIEQYDSTYVTQLTQSFAGKFGIGDWQDGDGEMVNRCFELMMRAEVDMTLFFTHLAKLDIRAPQVEILKIAFYTEQGYANFSADFAEWLTHYCQRVQHASQSVQARLAQMQTHNPRYVLRNYLAQQAIDLAENNDTSLLETLHQVLRNPYTEQAGMERFEAKRPDWARHKAGCSMLSCSS
ncbi:MAG: protein adenylyltransferase SelO family protein, partial [Methylophilus sp.]|nr:protein adenylyltransferase SelO family protein [Methylophilus sp.]